MRGNYFATMSQPRRAATTSKVVTTTKRPSAMGSLAAMMSIIQYHMTRSSLRGEKTQKRRRVLQPKELA